MNEPVDRLSFEEQQKIKNTVSIINSMIAPKIEDATEILQ